MSASAWVSTSSASNTLPTPSSRMISSPVATSMSVFLPRMRCAMHPVRCAMYAIRSSVQPQLLVRLPGRHVGENQPVADLQPGGDLDAIDGSATKAHRHAHRRVPVGRQPVEAALAGRGYA